MLNLKYRLLEKSPIINIVIEVSRNPETLELEDKVLFAPSIEETDQKLDSYELTIYKERTRYYIKVADRSVPCKTETYESLDVLDDDNHVVDIDEFILDKCSKLLELSRYSDSKQFTIYHVHTKLIRQSAFDNQVDLDCIKD